ncbi:hypothetical protein OXX79_012656 [Metschnikowia pulcherrima]
MSETTEPATIKDLVERFRKFSFRSETYPIKRGGNFVYQFDAAEIAPQQIREKKVQVSYIPTKENVADMFTKALAPADLLRCIELSGMKVHD